MENGSVEQTVNDYLAELEALFRKARLQWLNSTDDMLVESRAFLFDRGYGAIPHLRAYTSRSRDAERAKRGLPPLKTKPLDAPV